MCCLTDDGPLSRDGLTCAGSNPGQSVEIRSADYCLEEVCCEIDDGAKVVKTRHDCTGAIPDGAEVRLIHVMHGGMTGAATSGPLSDRRPIETESAGLESTSRGWVRQRAAGRPSLLPSLSAGACRR